MTSPWAGQPPHSMAVPPACSLLQPYPTPYPHSQPQRVTLWPSPSQGWCPLGQGLCQVLGTGRSIVGTLKPSAWGPQTLRSLWVLMKSYLCLGLSFQGIFWDSRAILATVQSRVSFLLGWHAGQPSQWQSLAFHLGQWQLLATPLGCRAGLADYPLPSVGVPWNVFTLFPSLLVPHPPLSALLVK